MCYITFHPPADEGDTTHSAQLLVIFHSPAPSTVLPHKVEQDLAGENWMGQDGKLGFAIPWIENMPAWNRCAPTVLCPNFCVPTQTVKPSQHNPEPDILRSEVGDPRVLSVCLFV